MMMSSEFLTLRRAGLMSRNPRGGASKAIGGRSLNDVALQGGPWGSICTAKSLGGRTSSD